MRYLVALMLGLAAPVAVQAADVRVELTGVRAGGTLYVQLQNRAQFMGNDRVAGQRVAAPAAGSVSVDLGEVPPGEYAVSVWHDDNGNQRFDVDPASGRVL